MGNSTVSAEVFEAILSDITDGMSMRQATVKAGVTRQSFLRYVDQDKDRADRYARAMLASCDAMADDIIDLSDICREGVKTTTKADGSVETVTGDMVERARLQIDARKWILCRRYPEKYGDRMGVAVSGNLKVVAVQSDVL